MPLDAVEKVDRARFNGMLISRRSVAQDDCRAIEVLRGKTAFVGGGGELGAIVRVNRVEDQHWPTVLIERRFGEVGPRLMPPANRLHVFDRGSLMAGAS